MLEIRLGAMRCLEGEDMLADTHSQTRSTSSLNSTNPTGQASPVDPSRLHRLPRWTKTRRLSPNHQIPRREHDHRCHQGESSPISLLQ